ncbi:MAG: TIGR04282 family arsenosugar biosynthesis glycosyltransferase [Opitutales bacterium]
MGLCLLFFLKAPIAGSVKTRLAADIGDARALGAYKRMTEHLLRSLAPFDALEIHFTPASGERNAEAELLIREWLEPVLGQSWTETAAFAQTEGDLGQRQSFAVEQAFRRQDSPLCLLGGDCPYVTRDHLERAYRGLEHNDLVIGPARDGGYYLLAINEPQPGLFDGIEWSTERVCAQLQRNARQLGLGIQSLETLEDVDDAPAWQRAQETLPLN